MPYTDFVALSIAEKLANWGILSPRVAREEEAELYLTRARLAAEEERFDDALVFCEKAREVAPESLAALYCVARIHDLGTGDRDRAIALYQKIIARAGYDSGNPYCAAARKALAVFSSGNSQG